MLSFYNKNALIDKVHQMHRHSRITLSLSLILSLFSFTSLHLHLTNDSSSIDGKRKCCMALCCVNVSLSTNVLELPVDMMRMSWELMTQQQEAGREKIETGGVERMREKVKLKKRDDV